MTKWIVMFFLTSLVMSAVALIIMIGNRLLSKKITATQQYGIWLIVLLGFVIPLRPTTGKGVFHIQLALFPNIIVGWGIITLCFMGYHAFRYIQFLKMIDRWSTPVDTEQTLNIFCSVKQEMGLDSKRIDLKICSFVSSSMLTGFIHPLILLPDKYFDEDELELIFKHELTHYKRHDLLIKLLMVITTCLHWFNPILHWMCLILQTEGEVACDEVVLQNADFETRSFYGELILGMIGRKMPVNSVLTTCFYAGKSNMKRRLDFIMEPTVKKGHKAIAVIIITSILVLSSGFVFTVTTAFAADQKGRTSQTDGPIPKSTPAVEQEAPLLSKTPPPDPQQPQAPPTPNTPTPQTAPEQDLQSSPIQDLQQPAASADVSALITAKKAQELALSKVGGGTITVFETDFDDNEPFYEIIIVYQQQEYEIEVNAATGKITDYNVEKLEDEDDD